MKARPAAVAVGSLLLALVRNASAEPLDPAFERFVTASSSGCRSSVGEFIPGGTPTNPTFCQPDNVAFKRFVNQLGFAFAPTAMHSARTTGYGGFDIALEGDFTKISSGADYWRRGTQGDVDPSTNSASTSGSPPGLLQLYSVRIRKGFGFGLEVAGTVGFMPRSSILSGGADVRMALLEGFRSGLLGIFPDVSVGGGVRTITGTPELQLTVVGLDAQISKPLPIQDSSILTPWIGYQYVWIFGDSGLIDLTPATNAQGYCGYAGNNVPGNPDPAKVVNGQQVYDGQPVCTAPGANPHLDFNNDVVFNPVRLKRHRLMFGLKYRYEMLVAGAEFITDLTSPADAQTNAADKADLNGESRQWTLALDLGAAF